MSEAEAPTTPVKAGEGHRPEPLTAAVWSLPGAVGLLGLMIAATLAAGFALAAVRSVDLGESVSSLVGGIALALVYVVVLAVVWVAARRRGVDFASSVGLRRVGIVEVLAAGIAMAVAGRLLAGLWALLLAAFDISLPGADLDPTAAFGEGPVAVAMIVLVGVVLAPFVEEVVFRGVLMPAFARRGGMTLGVIASSAAFAIVHFSAYAMPPIFGLALVLCAGFIRSRSLWVAVVAHAMFNAVGIGLLYFLRGLN